MADFVDELLNRRGYDRRIRPGVDTSKYTSKTIMISKYIKHIYFFLVFVERTTQEILMIFYSFVNCCMILVQCLFVLILYSYDIHMEYLLAMMQLMSL